METITANLAGKTRRSTLNGREYIVAPMTLIVPGVLPGSKGPLYYPQDELAKDPHAWNHMPVVVNHPFHNGRPVSARRPDIIEKFGIGFVFNTEMNTKLIAEGWFDVEKTRQVDGRVLNSLEAGTPLELSTGLFTKDEPAHNGAAYNGTPYVATARDYRPDHLAILPDQQGACGIRDGCGVLVNSVDPSALVPGDITERVDIDGEPGWRVVPVAPVGGWHQHTPEIYEELTANASQVGNELSHSGIDRQLEKALWAMFKSPEDLDRSLAGGIGGISPEYDSVPWLVEVFDGYVVYSKDGKTWALGYTVDHSNNQVSLEDGEPEEVTRVTEYVPVKNDASTQNAGKKMPGRSIKLSPAKACKILKDGQVNGRPLTKRQRGLFGAICGRGGGTRNAIDLDLSGVIELLEDEEELSSGLYAKINSFCATGPGGGIDPTCKAGGKKAENDERDKVLNDPDVLKHLKLPDVMYHVTTAEAAEKILKEGLKPNQARASTSGESRGVYLTDNPDDVSKQGGDVGGTVVLAIKTKGLNLRLDPEYFYYDDKSKKGALAYVEAVNAGEEQFAVYSTKKISPDHITLKNKKSTHNSLEYAQGVGRYLAVRGLDVDPGVYATINSFCATGPGGGIDPSCSPKGAGGGGAGHPDPDHGITESTPVHDKQVFRGALPTAVVSSRTTPQARRPPRAT
jgi:hypothetical protein